ncbi:MAG: VCBS domain-containing protein [Hyphomicrobiales bacterium]|nr:VCBS domain-containing protein [Hyphomicrobiales bacterium]
MAKPIQSDQIRTSPSFQNTPHARDDYFSAAVTGLAADGGIAVLDVMGNDLGGHAKTLWSLDDGVNGTGMMGGYVAGDLLTPTLMSFSALGATLSITDSGEIAYDQSTIDQADLPSLAEGEYIEDTFIYAIRLANGALSWATATVEIAGTNDAPSLAAGFANAFEDGPAVSVNLSLLGSDVDNDDDGATLSYAITGQPAEGSASVAGTELTFDPGSEFQDLAQGETRDVEIEITATDSHGAIAVNTVTVTVTGENDVPVANPDTDAAVTSAPAGFVLNPDNGHYYAYVAGGLTFAEASLAAEAAGGHLATITSAEENNFLKETFGSTGWIGASDANAEGVWQWVEGPEAGQTFWQGSTVTYDSWYSAEPNNAGNEDYAVLFGGGLSGFWNDIPGTRSDVGYYVEISDPEIGGGTITGSVAGNDFDPDNGAVLTYSLDAAVAGLTLDPDGGYSFDPNHPDYASLAVGETIEVVANYTVTDEFGASDSSTLSIEVSGGSAFQESALLI